MVLKIMDNTYNNVVEALIFASDEPIKSADIVKAIKGIDGEDTDIDADSVEGVVNFLNERYEETEKPFRIVRIAEGFLFGTKPEFAKYLGYLSSEKSRRRLSNSALETLAIVAYKQPITKPEIEAIRGVNIDYIMGSLLEKNLVAIQGRSETIGRPLLYGTTDEFLKYFGLNKLSDLPKPREIDEIMNDEEFIEQKQKLMMNELEEEMEGEPQGEQQQQQEPDTTE